jgi:adenosylhomocysteine nucleosidase
MLLRYLVSQYVRKAATQSLHDAVKNAAAGAAKQVDSPAEPGEPEAEPIRPEVIFLFALAVESGGLVDKLQNKTTLHCAAFIQHLGLLNGRPVAVLEMGVGQEAAGNATSDAIAIHKPDWIVSAGFAGALDASLRRGHILMANEIINADVSERLAVGLKIEPSAIESSPGLHVGSLVTVDNLVATPTEKKALGERTGALACDMESVAIARACRQHQTRLLSVRIITDGIDDQLPPEVEKLLAQDSLAAKLGAAAGAIFNRPSSVKDMWALKEEALRATDRLAKFLVSMLSQLN